jgi:TolB-like protein/DNA-binding winged helix-turn-helix (wHTH) protein
MAVPTQPAARARYRFEDFTLDTGARFLGRGLESIRLTLKEFDTLVVLVESAGQSVEKETLVQRVWPDTFVGDNSLARNISVLRKHLGASAIQTVPKHGYRFAWAVSLDSATQEKPLKTIAPSFGKPYEGSGTFLSILKSTGWRWAGGCSILLCLFMLGATATRARWQKHASHGPRPTPVRIAVLPFHNTSGKSEIDYLSDGIVEELITSLGQVNPNQLRVLANGSSSEYRRSTKKSSEIARELGVQFLLEGAVNIVDRSVDVSVHLVNGADQSVVWAGKFSRNLQQLPQIQAEITESVAREVEVNVISDATWNWRARETLDPLAHEAYLHGRMHLEQRTLPSFYQALEQFRNATVLDPKYARAYAGISETYINLANNTPTGPAYAYAKEAALTAIHLNDQLSEAHRDLAWVLAHEESDWQGAEREYQRSLDLNPSDSRTHHWYAQYLAGQRRPTLALKEAEAGLELDPVSLSSNYNYAFMLIEAGQFDAAIAHLQRLLLREPNSEVVYGYLGIAYDRKHDYGKSVIAFRRAMEVSGLKRQYEANLARSLAFDGKTAEARRIANNLDAELDKGVWMPACNLALTYFALGDKGEGFRLLRRSLKEHSCTLLELNTEPVLVALDGEPRLSTIRSQFHLGSLPVANSGPIASPDEQPRAQPRH